MTAVMTVIRYFCTFYSLRSFDLAVSPRLFQTFEFILVSSKPSQLLEGTYFFLRSVNFASFACTFRRSLFIIPSRR